MENITVAQCFIAVDDHDKALVFYRDVVGLEVRQDVSNGGMRWLTVGAAGQPDLGIVIEPPLADPGASDADKKAADDLLKKGYLRGLNFSTDDVEATFARMKAAGGEVLQEPTDQFWGVRDCAFRDPAGNMVRFAQPKN